jgi:hypothetical protein
MNKMKHSLLFSLGLVYGALMNGLIFGIQQTIYSFIRLFPLLLNIFLFLVVAWAPAVILNLVLGDVMLATWLGIGISSALVAGSLTPNSALFLMAYTIVFPVIVLTILGTSMLMDGIGIGLLVAGTLAAGWGMLFGVAKGTWHCAKDFSNNGIIRGLSSPFRLMKALFLNSPHFLQEYYTQATSISKEQLEVTASAEIEQYAAVLESKTLLPNDPLSIITEYAIDETHFDNLSAKDAISQYIEGPLYSPSTGPKLSATDVSGLIRLHFFGSTEKQNESMNTTEDLVASTDRSTLAVL